MIVSFECTETRALFETGRSRRFANILAAAERKLTLLDAAATLSALRTPPGNRLEVLRGDLATTYSIRVNSVNNKWRRTDPPRCGSSTTTKRLSPSEAT